MKKVIPIINLASEFANIKRAVGYRTGHLENDAEHSYQLAMACWAANEQYNLGLKDELIFKFALAHDLVEVYAGDTDAFGDQQKIIDKKEKESVALEKLKETYSQFKDILTMIERYEKKEDIEAQLVYVMDKFVANVNIYYSNAEYYRDRDISINDWRQWSANKINYDSLDEKIRLLFDESVKEVELNFKDIFSKEGEK